MARMLGAEVINFNEEHPVEALQRLTGGIGPDITIDVVGVDAYHAHQGPAAKLEKAQEQKFAQELAQNNPAGYEPEGGNWVPGDAPSQALQWEIESVAKGADYLSVMDHNLTTLRTGLDCS
jgi:threonine dehydrogenase-like Zn-dependent dehydrogenase